MASKIKNINTFLLELQDDFDREIRKSSKKTNEIKKQSDDKKNQNKQIEEKIKKQNKELILKLNKYTSENDILKEKISFYKKKFDKKIKTEPLEAKIKENDKIFQKQIKKYKTENQSLLLNVNENKSKIEKFEIEIEKSQEQTKLLRQKLELEIKNSKQNIKDIEEENERGVKKTLNINKKQYEENSLELRQKIQENKKKYDIKNVQSKQQVQQLQKTIEENKEENAEKIQQYQIQLENLQNKKIVAKPLSDIASVLGALKLISDISDKEMIEILNFLKNLNKNSQNVFENFISKISKSNVDFLEQCKKDFTYYLNQKVRFNDLENLLKKLQKKSTSLKLPQKTINSINHEFKQNFTSLSLIGKLMKLSAKSDQNETNCKNISSALKDLSLLENSFKNIEENAMNLKEDIGGAVRVYVRIFNEKHKKTPAFFKDNISMKNRRTVSLNYTKFPYDSSTPEFLDISRTCSKINTDYGDFFEVFDKDESNKQIFSGSIDNNNNTSMYQQFYNDDNSNLLNEIGKTNRGGIYKTIAQIKEGYSIVISGYGLSGSGKTFTLFGTKTDPGLLYLALENIPDVQSFSVDSVFEEAVNQVDWKDKNYTIKGKVLFLFGTDNTFDKFLKHIQYASTKNRNVKEVISDTREEFKKNYPGGLKTATLENVENHEKFNKLLKQMLNQVNVFRKNRNRIRKTPNNDESSRSHLYITIKIILKTGKIGFLTIVDQAGKENPFSIKEQLFAQQLSIETIIGQIPNNFNLKLKSNYDIFEAQKIVKEGLYISESLFNLQMFYKSKNSSGEKINYIRKPEKFKTPDTPEKIERFLNSSFENITEYLPETDHLALQDKQKKSNNINILTIPIMQYLDDLSKKAQENSEEFRPSKFVFMLAVRTNGKYCADTASTLNFGLSVS
jgi:hypothetical protein